MVTLGNWSNCNHIIKVPFHENYEQFNRSVCVELRTHPVYLYFLGDEKTKEKRLRLPKDISLAECLAMLSGWDPASNRLMPEILFEIHQLPTGSPDTTEKRRAASRDEDAQSAGGSSVRCRSAKFSPMIMRRDARTCDFCGAKSVEHETAHRFEHREEIDVGNNLEELLQQFSLSDVDDKTNALYLCLKCYEGVDADTVCMNPGDNTLHVA
jgi:hypothetical protein